MCMISSPQLEVWNPASHIAERESGDLPGSCGVCITG